MHRSLKVDTPPSDPVFTTAQAKEFLKVDVSTDDTLIDNLVLAATESCQIYTNQYFMDTVVTQYSDTWDDFYTLYKSPVASITHVKYYDSDDSQQTLASSNYILGHYSKPARIGVAVGGTLPNLSDRINAVEVKYTVGYGTASTDVPEGIRTAIILTVGKLV